MQITKNTPKDMITKIAEECHKCGHCCTFGSGFLVEEDISKIAKFLGTTEQELKEKHLEKAVRFNTELFRPKVKRENKPYGPCVFYSQRDGCTIHPVKPLQCKMNKGCGKHGEELYSWFILNYCVNADDKNSIREYASYIKAGGKVIPGGNLLELIPDEKTLRKIIDQGDDE